MRRKKPNEGAASSRTNREIFIPKSSTPGRSFATALRDTNSLHFGRLSKTEGIVTDPAYRAATTQKRLFGKLGEAKLSVGDVRGLTIWRRNFL